MHSRNLFGLFQPFLTILRLGLLYFFLVVRSSNALALFIDFIAVPIFIRVFLSRQLELFVFC